MQKLYPLRLRELLPLGIVCVELLASAAVIVPVAVKDEVVRPEKDGFEVRDGVTECAFEEVRLDAVILIILGIE